ncbi:MAG: DUF503 domain-containing protein [Armatimonadetes bacterium]|nr:DUF503 domain-containing protein [Armatimonadota bacterium]
MVVATCRVDLHLLEEPQSLKGKRHILRGLKDRIRNKFEVSIAEVGDNHLWQRASLGVACVSNSKEHANSVISKVLDFLEREREIDIIESSVEIL